MEIFCQTMAANYPTDYLAYDKKAQNQFNTFTGLQCICSGKHSVPFRTSVSDLGFQLIHHCSITYDVYDLQNNTQLRLFLRDDNKWASEKHTNEDDVLRTLIISEELTHNHWPSKQWINWQ